MDLSPLSNNSKASESDTDVTEFITLNFTLIPVPTLYFTGCGTEQGAAGMKELASFPGLYNVTSVIKLPTESLETAVRNAVFRVI